MEVLKPSMAWLNKYTVPQIVNLHKHAVSQNWNHWVGDNIIQTKSKHYISKSGKNKIKFYTIDAGIVLQRLLIDSGGTTT